ncbi:hypothetical protein CN168_16590 [Sinorhizobium medicae]|nr:hypothetical protein CN168_16590 [Sinorhizobium medicae]
MSESTAISRDLHHLPGHDPEVSHILTQKANLVTSEGCSRALAKASEDPALYMHDTRRLAGRLLC